MFSRLSFLNPYWLWVILALPAYGALSSAIGSDDPKVLENLLHPTGEFAARFLIISLIATPLAMLFHGARFPRWLKKNRRYFGVAAFLYAALHLGLYVVDTNSILKILSEATKFEFWTGWVAFLIFIPLAVTSWDYFVRRMGPRWKALQRLTYLAAVLVLAHWAVTHDWKGLAPALVHFAPLILLEGYRVWYWISKRRARAALA